MFVCLLLVTCFPLGCFTLTLARCSAVSSVSLTVVTVVYVTEILCHMAECISVDGTEACCHDFTSAVEIMALIVDHCCVGNEVPCASVNHTPGDN